MTAPNRSRLVKVPGQAARPMTAAGWAGEVKALRSAVVTAIQAAHDFRQAGDDDAADRHVEIANTLRRQQQALIAAWHAAPTILATKEG